jgi:hypothetical protein
MCSRNCRFALRSNRNSASDSWGRTGGIVSYACPQLLIKSRQLQPRVFHHLTVAPRRSNLVFGKVRKDLSDRPLILAGPCCELLIGRFCDRLRENRWRLPLQF